MFDSYKGSIHRDAALKADKKTVDRNHSDA
jgi:hypothetical protein